MSDLKDKRVYRIALTGLLAALSYVAFTFLQIKVPLPGGDATSFHLGNTVCVLGALVAGSFYGGMGGAIGMTIGDLLDPIYITSAPKTFILKFCIGLIAGTVAHRAGHINRQTEQKKILMWTVAASVCSLGFNVIFDPIFGYYYKLYIIGKPAAELVLKWNFVTTGTNAVISAIAATVIYLSLRPVLKKTGMLPEI
ncbi:MAG: ECF transporter S component [Lachnospiraceae bacterium]|nr:ECF transporter S component [Lachnospiraceae bacterium]